MAIPLTSQRGRGVYGVQYLDSINGTRATFVCKAGHKMTKDYGKGPISRRMPEAALRRFSKYWGMVQPDGKRYGHVYGYCKACDRAAQKAEATK